MLIPAYARLAGLLIGARVDVQISAASRTPLAPLGFGRLDFQLTATPTDSDRVLLPLQAATLSGRDVELGWKAPALLLAPLWLAFARPMLLPLLLLAWVRLPNTGSGALEWEAFATSDQLNRGLWRWMLGLVLDGIGRSSLPGARPSLRLTRTHTGRTNTHSTAILTYALQVALTGFALPHPPGMLASLNPDGSSSPARLPRSACTGVSVGKGGKLVLQGRLQSFEVRGREGGPGAVAGPVEYTLRTGLRPGSVEADGTLLEEAASAGSGRSCLLWDTPELRLSLDSLGWAARLLPQIWVPVAAACCVVLPRGARLRRAVVSEAGDGVSASGEFALAREADVYALAVR